METLAQPKPAYWEVRELVVIGTFAAVVKVSSLVVALLGGGMNPLTLILKNLVFTSLLFILLCKVRKPGALMVFLVVSALLSVMLLGAGLMLIPASLVAGAVAELAMLALRRLGSTWVILLGVALYDLVSKSLSLAVSWAVVREQPQVLVMSAAIIAIGYLGSLLGLVAGLGFLKELRHAGIVHV
ncbi:MptD family putative ECF transporter S component [Geothrix sp. 21YS21S-4]|uniref:MptD family putative ECF transporter S component n=1 Tax=Geothrix sp. 21YS21S-4 TaxID=3068889 RepID=UPI0027B8D2D8|nr:MptD family putative ECF transporter S component [Geothrix sp. 21YS21S-4]